MSAQQPQSAAQQVMQVAGITVQAGDGFFKLKSDQDDEHITLG